MESINIRENRKTTSYSLDISSGIFKSNEEATRYADNLKVYLKRSCKKGSYDCFALFSISQNNARKNIKIVNRTGNVGRPKIQFRALNENNQGAVDHHIHIVIFANPGATIVNLLIDKIKNDFGKEYGDTHVSINNKRRSPYWKQKLMELLDFTKCTKYILRQSSSNRILYYNSNNMIDFMFIKELIKDIEQQIQEENTQLLVNKKKYVLDKITTEDKKQPKSMQAFSFKIYILIILTHLYIAKVLENTYVYWVFLMKVADNKLECNTSVHSHIYTCIDYIDKYSNTYLTTHIKRFTNILLPNYFINLCNKSPPKGILNAKK